MCVCFYDLNTTSASRSVRLIAAIETQHMAAAGELDRLFGETLSLCAASSRKSPLSLKWHQFCARRNLFIYLSTCARRSAATCARFCRRCAESSGRRRVYFSRREEKSRATRQSLNLINFGDKTRTCFCRLLLGAASLQPLRRPRSLSALCPQSKAMK